MAGTGAGVGAGVGAGDQKQEKVAMEDILCQPGRKVRPERIVVIVRGPPGAGKTYVTKLLKVSRKRGVDKSWFMI